MKASPVHRRRLPVPLALLTPLLAGAALLAAGEDPAPTPPRGGIVVAPVLYYTPETRIAWGFVGIHYFRLGPAPSSSRLSHYRFNVIRTQNRQSIAQADYEIYLPGGRFLLDGTVRYSYYPDRFYGIGNRTAEADREDFTSSSWRLRLDLQHRWEEALYAGLRLEVHSISLRETQAGGALAAGGIPGDAGGSLAGLGILAKWDSRDNTFSTSRGTYASASLSRFFGVMGSGYTFSLLELDARRYWRLGRNPVLAVQGVFRSARGECPFQLLPRFGGLNLLRGYYEGRYRGRTLAAFQGECRLSLGRRVGLCAFAGAAQVQERASLLALDGFHAAAGGGLRYRFNPRENLVIRLDAGFAGPQPAFYLTFAEAF